MNSRFVRAAPCRAVPFIFLLMAMLLGGCAAHPASPTARLNQHPVAPINARAELEQVIAALRLRLEHGANPTPEYAYQLAVREVARQAGQPAAALGAAIDAWVAEVLRASRSTPYDLALARFKGGDFALAAEQAGKAVEQAKSVGSAMLAEAIRAALLQGQAAHAAGQFEAALQAYRNAAMLIEPGSYPRESARAEDGLGLALHELGRAGEAESLWRLALMKRKQQSGSVNPDAANALANLAVLLDEIGRPAEAEPLLRHALAIETAYYGEDHPYVAQDLDLLAQLLEDTDRAAQAEPLRRRALAIAEAAPEESPPTVAARLTNLALVLKYLQRAEEAEALIRRALGIDAASYGQNSPEVAADLGNLAQLLKDANRLAEAEPLMRAALAIAEARHGADHLDVAIDLNNLAQLLEATQRLDEAEPLARRATTIFATNLGWEHAITGKVHQHWLGLMRAMGKGKPEIDRRQSEMQVPLKLRENGAPERQ